METILRFEFDSTSFFPKNFKGRRNIIIKNPPLIPATGEKVDIKMADFFEDKKLLENFEDYSDGLLLYADRITSVYGKDNIEVIMVLYEEQIFKQLRPQFSESNFID